MNNSLRTFLIAGLVLAAAISVIATSSSSQNLRKDLALNLATPAPVETIAQRDQRMKWWREARFGMFIHWGLYAVPAGEYQGKRSERIGEWIMEWANIPRAEYEKFATTASPFEAELAFGRATSKPGKIYLHVFNWPANGTLRVPALGNEVRKAYLLANPKNKIGMTQGGDGITIAVPATALDPIATVIVLEHAR